MKNTESQRNVITFSLLFHHKTSFYSHINAYPAFFSKHRSLPESLPSKVSLAENDAKINCLRSHLPRLSRILVEADELDLAHILYFKYIIFPL